MLRRISDRRNNREDEERNAEETCRGVAHMWGVIRIAERRMNLSNNFRIDDVFLDPNLYNESAKKFAIKLIQRKPTTKK
ncbi:hypothetical protein KIN20_028486 [Parelaphostrongylus tenuis]|uniref:Uncharacterized protein n=1 Tax=Parelaphostrongylus tenuis TaxID=148309 RepID=A0AAD5WEU3_PARTN|nr:hypothetical protein KIN20_028486 [Parelaphostrongylus tenuis]